MSCSLCGTMEGQWFYQVLCVRCRQQHSVCGHEGTQVAGGRADGEVCGQQPVHHQLHRQAAGPVHPHRALGRAGHPRQPLRRRGHLGHQGHLDHQII